AGLLPSASDPHHGLRRVEILRLTSGVRVVYKPRPMKIEASWNDLLEYLGRSGAQIDFLTYRILDKGAYGWAAYVQGEDCRDRAEIQSYVTRAGALLAIVYLVGGSDCHADNLVAAGAYPVLIDVETLLSPKSRDGSACAEAPRAAHAML